jgi:hypothetical protein
VIAHLIIRVRVVKKYILVEDWGMSLHPPVGEGDRMAGGGVHLRRKALPQSLCDSSLEEEARLKNAPTERGYARIAGYARAEQGRMRYVTTNPGYALYALTYASKIFRVTMSESRLMAYRTIHTKKNGAKYVYSVEGYWDKEKQAPRNR